MGGFGVPAGTGVALVAAPLAPAGAGRRWGRSGQALGRAAQPGRQAYAHPRPRERAGAVDEHGRRADAANILGVPQRLTEAVADRGLPVVGDVQHLPWSFVPGPPVRAAAGEQQGDPRGGVVSDCDDRRGPGWVRCPRGRPPSHTALTGRRRADGVPAVAPRSTEADRAVRSGQCRDATDQLSDRRSVQGHGPPT